MRIEYTAEGASEPTVWTWDKDDVLSTHAEMIEKRFGDTWEKFNVALAQGAMRARRILLWHLMFLVHPGLRIEDVPPFRARDFKVEFGYAEIVDMIERLAKLKPKDENDAADNDRIRTFLLAERIEAAKRDGVPVDDDGNRLDDESGKVLSNTEGEPTG